MAAYIAIFLSLVSIILMIIILIRFKKLFSTDAIIDKTKAQMNRVIMDVNNNANRDLELLNESSHRLRALLNDADKKMENFSEAAQLLRNLIAESEKAVNSKSGKVVYVEPAKTSEIKSSDNKAKTKTKVNPYIDPDSSYRVNKVPPAAGTQQSLFDDVDNEPEQKTILKDETIVTSQGAAYKEVPLIISKVYEDKTSNQKSNRSLKENVERLFNSGMQIDDIAAELSCSTSEVQFIIDML